MGPRYQLSDSESEAEIGTPAVPADNVLEQGLRDEVAAIFNAGNMEELTVKRVRVAVEKKLGLEEGFFKGTGNWKAQSDKIIKQEAEMHDNMSEAADANTKKTSPSLSPQPNKVAPKRPKGGSTPKPRKRQKTQTPVSDEQENAPSGPSGEESEDEVAQPQTRKPPVQKASKSRSAKINQPELSDRDNAADGSRPTTEANGDNSESEMSVVLDEEPNTKLPRKRKSGDGPAKKEKKPTPKNKDEDVDPDQAEIKRLQGWLVKCGIRKMWWRELQPYETSKAKIKHLKQMLEDAGMTGRYSIEKARQIRDERELKADLEQIQQGAKQWGTGSGDEGSDAAPRRRAARGRQALAFLESDGEETD
ncbi:hypothetical protein N7462_001913 [Penicillium macrosclerotiorum]|uniref:uncharacterized protein n=1 Tax=Penicillium macrosclerotiorum TaxID=303699 RepID=UPI002546FA72|nr:uncharacterized protein N7462_001913 [Penicillium macrosclerotiorum]KAJ5692490.1 hypothetical protein N7462_001913 [Penicillium macrosclerotiorum]